MKYEDRPCSIENCDCHYIVNRTKWLCDDHNQIRIHGVTRRERLLEKQRLTPKKKKKAYIYKPKNPGKMKALFLEIWEERVDEDGNRWCTFCPDKLGHEPKAYNFSHRKGKLVKPSWKYRKDKIDLSCEECHTEHEFVSLQNRKKNLK